MPIKQPFCARQCQGTGTETREAVESPPWRCPKATWALAWVLHSGCSAGAGLCQKGPEIPASLSHSGILTTSSLAQGLQEMSAMSSPCTRDTTERVMGFAFSFPLLLTQISTLLLMNRAS